MKLHFSISATEELRERRGGRYVLYSVCLEGFLLGKARYSQLRRWDAQLRQLFGSAVPAFPPKFYLAMTKSMADERRTQLEQYLQNVTLHSNITKSDVFIGFFRKLQQDTFKIQTQRAFLDVYLADGSNVRLDIQTSDTAERILEVTSCEMGLSRELIKYFSLFFFQDHDDGALSVVKKVADFELPYVSLQSMKELHCKLGIRKWYMDPSLDTLLMDCRTSLNLLYMQAIQEVKRNWVKPTEGQMQELKFLQKNANKAKGATKDGEEDTLEFRFEYNDSGTWQWIILHTKQAFLLSSCLKKIILEQMMKAAKEGQEMEIKMPESMKNSKKSSIQQKQVVHSGFVSRKRFLLRPNEDNSVFEKIREEDL
ncbi:sorting nexin-31 isoform X3 [Phalacrocorax carbo]|uniref:sorting nexin-31 isoform X3 n=1 Tax=Phalacrocorax carbo TaxID=9209 RepID=UPI00311A07C9